MIPYGTLSSTAVPSLYEEKVKRRTQPLIDYERGGRAIGDASTGLSVQLWTLRWDSGAFLLSGELVSEFTLFSATDVTELSLAFDQNMQPAVAYVQSGVAKLRWFDTAVGSFVITDFAGAITPRITLDEKRAENLNSSDIILSYLIGTNLYFRMQRERFLTEHLLASGVNARLITIGMNKGLRLQWKLLPND